MSLDNKIAESKTKKHRPFGVWVLTLYALLWGVFILFFTGVWNILQGYTALYNPKEVPEYYVYAFLSISIIITSILTWGGVEVGRKAFLVVITLFFVGDLIRNYGWGTWIPDSGDMGGWFLYITDIVFPLLCIWYFNKPSTKEFYRRVEKDAIDSKVLTG
jgi:hypothetical protein